MFNSIVVRKNPALFLTAAVAVVIILLLLARTVSAASGGNANENNNGNQQVLAQLTVVQQQIADVNARLDTMDTTLLALGDQVDVHDTDVSTLISTETDEVDGAISDLSTQTDNHGTAVGTLISTETQQIDDAITDLSASLTDHDTAVSAQIIGVAASLGTTLTEIQEDADGHINPNPFTVSVNTCATLSGGGEFGGELSGGVELGAKGSVGAEAAGTGVKGESKLQGTLMAKLGLLGGVEIAHTVCNAGIWETSSVEEEDYTSKQQTTIDDYENAAYLLQSHNESSSGGLLASSMDEQLDLVSLGDQMGLGISDIVSSLNALSELNGLPTDPSALIAGNSSLNDFVDALDFGESVDTGALLGTFTDPCATLGSLGEAAQEICDNPSASIEETLLAMLITVDEIDNTVSDIDAAIDGTFTTALISIQETADELEFWADETFTPAIQEVETQVIAIGDALDVVFGPAIQGLQNTVNSVLHNVDPSVAWSIGGLVYDAWDCVTNLFNGWSANCGNGK